MASEKRPFSHITVNVEEEDDLVIQAGAVDAVAELNLFAAQLLGDLLYQLFRFSCAAVVNT